jgi:hypothetical protein
VADDFPVHLGHERHLGKAAITQGIDKVRFGVTVEHYLIDAPDRHSVLLGFWSDCNAHFCSIDSRLKASLGRP